MMTKNAIRSKRWKLKHPEENRRRALEYYYKNRDKINKKRRLYRSKNKKFAREYVLRTKYNLSLEQLNEMMVNQNNECAICHRHQKDISKSFSVDHNHATGQVRGLLCDPCNIGIGMLKDSVINLQSAINYLKRSGNGSQRR